ncbi:hypothetical protein Tco_1517779 [Tanacetum coccineum]
METQKPLLKDEDGEEVDVHMYRSMIGSLMYLTSSRPDIMFAVCVCARYQVNPKVLHLHVVKRIFRYLKGQPKLGFWYPKDSLFDLIAYTDSDYARASLDRKSTIEGCQFLGGRLISWHARNRQVDRQIPQQKLSIWLLQVVMDKCFAKTINGEVQLHALVDGKKIIIIESTVKRDLQLEDAEGVDCLPNSTIFETTTLMGPKTTVWNEFSSTMASSIICFATNQKFDFSKFIFEYEAVHKELGDSLVRVATTASSLEVKQDSSNIKATPNESSSLETTLGGGLRLKLNELMELCTNLQNKVLDLEKAKTTQQNEIDSLKRRVKKLEKKRSSRSHKLKRLYKVDDADNEMFDVNVLNGEEVFVVGQNENVVEEVVDDVQVSVAAITITITTEEITLAQALEALKTTKPNVKGIVFQEPSTTTTITTISSQQSLDKSKGIMIKEPVKPMKKKVQIMLDEEAALKLQGEFDEEERLAKEKAKKEKEANIALIKEWDDIQAKIDDDH